MSPKWAKKSHFGDISYNVFNRRKSSYYIVETLYFSILSRLNNFNENNQPKLIVIVYMFTKVTKTCLPGFDVTEYSKGNNIIQGTEGDQQDLSTSHLCMRSVQYKWIPDSLIYKYSKNLTTNDSQTIKKISNLDESNYVQGMTFLTFHIFCYKSISNP